jgi:hypothetical protein
MWDKKLRFAPQAIDDAYQEPHYDQQYNSPQCAGEGVPQQTGVLDEPSPTRPSEPLQCSSSRWAEPTDPSLEVANQALSETGPERFILHRQCPH